MDKLEFFILFFMFYVFFNVIYRFYIINIIKEKIMFVNIILYVLGVKVEVRKDLMKKIKENRKVSFV